MMMMMGWLVFLLLFFFFTRLLSTRVSLCCAPTTFSLALTSTPSHSLVLILHSRYLKCKFMQICVSSQNTLSLLKSFLACFQPKNMVKLLFKLVTCLKPCLRWNQRERRGRTPSLSLSKVLLVEFQVFSRPAVLDHLVVSATVLLVVCQCHQCLWHQ